MKKIAFLTVALFAIAMVVSFCGKGDGSSGGSDGKYGTLNSVIAEAVKIAKENKDNPEEAKKKVAALVEKDKDKLKAEAEAFSKEIEPKMNEYMEKMKKDFQDNPEAAQDMQGAMQKAMDGMMEIMGKDLPAMKDALELQMSDPEAAQILSGLDDVMKDIQPKM